MHPVLADKIVESVRLRHSQGDCPTEPAQSVEMLEGAVLELADRPARTLRTLASALKQFAPDITAQIVERWQTHKRDEDKYLQALLGVMRGEPGDA